MTNESTLAVVASVWGPRRGPAVRAADRPDAPHPLVVPVLRRLVRGAEHRLRRRRPTARRWATWPSPSPTSSPTRSGCRRASWPDTGVTPRRRRRSPTSTRLLRHERTRTTAWCDTTGARTAGACPTRLRERHHRAAAAVCGRVAVHHRVDFEMAHRVAEAFSAAPRSSSETRVESAYAALGEQAGRVFPRPDQR